MRSRRDFAAAAAAHVGAMPGWFTGARDDQLLTRGAALSSVCAARAELVTPEPVEYWREAYQAMHNGGCGHAHQLTASSAGKAVAGGADQ